MSRRLRPMLAILLILAMLLAACGGDEEPDPTPTAQQGVEASSDNPAATSDPGIVQQTPVTDPAAGETPVGDGGPVVQPTEEPKTLWPANELGQIPILEYHHLGDEPEQFVRTPDQLRADLQWLYENDFYVVNLQDILNDNLNVPAGKRPVALTFDDSPASQFRLIPLSDGRLAIDPNCAVGILELFFVEHPDFGRGGHFAVLPNYFFDWTPEEGEPDQTQYVEMKFRWLLDNGYELGNHTMDHTNLAELTDEEIKYQLAEANDAIHAIAPDALVDVITLPYGMYPAGGDDTLFRGFEYEGRYYEFAAALLVGANPTAAPISTEYDPYAMARIQAFDEELDKWFAVFEEQPGILYVSDGDPNTVTVPEDLHPWLVGTLDMSKIGNRELVRY